MRICSACWHREGPIIRSIRRQVFTDEQGVDEALDLDGQDPTCFHVLAWERHDLAVGTARITPGGKIGRMAVLKEWRRQGVGGLMLQSLLAHGAEQGLQEVYLHAQLTAVAFYQRHGFIREGAPFEEAGIAHVRMIRPLGEDSA